MPAPYTTPDNQAQTVALLRDAIVTVGYPKVTQLLPAPFILWCHDVSRYTIQLKEDGQESVVAWRGSRWPEPSEGNLGLNPEVPFCRIPLERFFERVNDLLVNSQANDIANSEARKIAAETRRKNTIEHYRQKFEGFELRP